MENAQGRIAASSRREALTLLAQQALYPLDVRDTSQTPAWHLSQWQWLHRRRVNAETIADTLTQLSDLLTNGVSLLESLNIMAQQSAEGSMRESLDDGPATPWPMAPIWMMRWPRTRRSSAI